MYCYILQGTLGILALAAIIAGLFGTLWVFINAGEWVSKRVHPPKWADNAVFVLLIIGLSVVLSIGAWKLGGDVLKQFFHFCLG